MVTMVALHDSYYVHWTGTRQTHSFTYSLALRGACRDWLDVGNAYSNISQQNIGLCCDNRRLSRVNGVRLCSAKI